MSFPVPTTTAIGGTGFSFDAQNAASAAATKPTFSFGNAGGGDADNAKISSFGVGVGVSQPAASTSNAPTLTAAPVAATQPALTGFSNFPTATSQASAAVPATTIGLALPTQAKATGGAIVGLGGGGALSTATTSTGGGGFANLSTATKTTDSASVAHLNNLSYNQLEEYINKWTLEFEEQEKVFTEQATQINAWDKILISNNEKILELNDAVQKVKADQQLLEQELEFIGTQHKELEESILPLQKEFAEMPQVDIERSQTYLLVENLDTQLKQMSADLKEIIDNLNESNKGQDNTDPIIQIGKILNAHMSSLQWIEESSTNICNKLDDIGKIHESQKREAYKSTYYK